MRIEFMFYSCVLSTLAFWSLEEKLKDKNTKQSWEKLEDMGEQGEQGPEGEGCLIMMSPSLLGKQALSSETLSCSKDGLTMLYNSGGPRP